MEIADRINKVFSLIEQPDIYWELVVLWKHSPNKSFREVCQFAGITKETIMTVVLDKLTKGTLLGIFDESPKEVLEKDREKAAQLLKNPDQKIDNPKIGALLQMYKDEMSKAKKEPSCTSCAINRIKNKYSELLARIFIPNPSFSILDVTFIDLFQKYAPVVYKRIMEEPFEALLPADRFFRKWIWDTKPTEQVNMHKHKTLTFNGVALYMYLNTVNPEELSAAYDKMALKDKELFADAFLFEA